MVVSPITLPRFMAAATLYSFPPTDRGAPANTRISLSAVYSAILMSASFAALSRTSWVKRSLHVYPVTHNSGNTIIFAFCSHASLTASHIFAVLNSTSATRISGVAAATLTNPCFIFPSAFLVGDVVKPGFTTSPFTLFSHFTLILLSLFSTVLSVHLLYSYMPYYRNGTSLRYLCRHRSWTGSLSFPR